MALKVEINETSAALRKTFTIEKKHQEYLVQLSAEMMKKFGRNVSASETLRAIIDRDMEENK